MNCAKLRLKYDGNDGIIANLSPGIVFLESLNKNWSMLDWSTELAIIVPPLIGLKKSEQCREYNRLFDVNQQYISLAKHSFMISSVS